MFKKIYFTFTIVLAIFFSILFQSCGEDTVNASQDFISGTITYSDTNIQHTSGFYYAVSLYGDSTSPFSHYPLETDSVQVSVSGGTASAYYKISGLPSGNYYVASTYVNSNNGNILRLGELGCDENLGCSTPTKVTVPNYAGTGGQNFKSKSH